MIIEIPEWGTADRLELTSDQIAALAGSEAFKIQPDVANQDCWRVSARQFVGVAHVGDLQIRVTPKVPVHRLLELLCTSIDRVQWNDRDTKWAESDDLLTTVAASFLTQAERVLHGGLLQGYVTVDEGLFGVRGRIDLGRQITRNPGLPLPIEVSYDDYTIDIVENQLIAGAGRLLLRLGSLPITLTARLRRLESQLIDVRPSPATTTPPPVVWSRLNLRYRPAVTLARMILRSSALEFEGAGSTIGDAFLVDMNQVFEDIVGFGIRSALLHDGFTTHLQHHDHLDLDRRLEIRPDIVVTDHVGPVVAADVKYKRPFTTGISNGDVYQIVAYAGRFGLTHCSLIYAEPPPYEMLRVGDVIVRLDWIDLDQPPEERSEALSALAQQLVSQNIRSLAHTG